MSREILLAVDQGTTSTRCISFDTNGNPRQSSRRELRQFYPHPGWVEHDPEDIWRDTVETMRQVADAESGELLGIGITNQRESVVVWDRDTGAPIHNAIVGKIDAPPDIATS